MARVRTGFFQKRGTPIRKGGNPQYPFQNATDLNILGQIETIYFSKFWSKKRKSSKKKKEDSHPWNGRSRKLLIAFIEIFICHLRMCNLQISSKYDTCFSVHSATANHR